MSNETEPRTEIEQERKRTYLIAEDNRSVGNVLVDLIKDWHPEAIIYQTDDPAEASRIITELDPDMTIYDGFNGNIVDIEEALERQVSARIEQERKPPLGVLFSANEGLVIRKKREKKLAFLKTDSKDHTDFLDLLLPEVEAE